MNLLDKRIKLGISTELEYLPANVFKLSWYNNQKNETIWILEYVLV